MIRNEKQTLTAADWEQEALQLIAERGVLGRVEARAESGLTALVGRVPVRGQVRDPMPFKVITGGVVSMTCTVRVTCTWDRSLVDMPEPRYITWSDGTVDEMCFSPLSVLPDEQV